MKHAILATVFLFAASAMATEAAPAASKSEVSPAASVSAQEPSKEKAPSAKTQKPHGKKMKKGSRKN